MRLSILSLLALSSGLALGTVVSESSASENPSTSADSTESEGRFTILPIPPTTTNTATTTGPPSMPSMPMPSGTAPPCPSGGSCGLPGPTTNATTLTPSMTESRTVSGPTTEPSGGEEPTASETSSFNFAPTSGPATFGLALGLGGAVFLGL